MSSSLISFHFTLLFSVIMMMVIRTPPTMKETSSFDNNKPTTTVVGSTEYYQGFITRSMNEEPTERVTGDAILGPTLKFAGGISLLLILFTGIFLVSNGII